MKPILSPRHALLPLLLWAGASTAQTLPFLPDAGDALRELQAAPPALPQVPRDQPFPELFGPGCGTTMSCPMNRDDSGPRFLLRDIVLQGNDSVPTAELAPLYAADLGQPASLATLDAIAERITAHYRALGYVLAQALVPAQDATEGRIELTILEGRLGSVRVVVAPDAPIGEAAVRGRLAGLQPGAPLLREPLEGALLRLSDLPGLRVSSAIEAGGEPGTVDLTVNIDAQERWAVAAELDNYGIRSTGEWRASLTGRINSPLRLGDNLDFRLLATQRGDTLYGSLGYELPVGMQGTRVGVGVARLAYELGQEFAALDAHGTATVLNLTVSHPLLRTRAQTLLLRGGLEYRRLVDRIGALSLENRKTLTDASLGLAYEGRDDWLGGGFTHASLTVLAGHLRLHSDAERQFDASAIGRRTAGNSVRAQFSLSRLNAVAGGSTLFAGVTGQVASRNLDNAARMALGGPRAVRAYAPSEAIVDEGLVATVEWRHALTADLTGTVFYDWGWGRRDARPRGYTGDNVVRRAGAGVGVYWNGPEGFVLAGSLAWRTTTSPDSSSDRKPRLYLQLSKTF